MQQSNTHAFFELTQRGSVDKGVNSKETRPSILRIMSRRVGVPISRVMKDGCVQWVKEVRGTCSHVQRTLTCSGGEKQERRIVVIY